MRWESWNTVTSRAVLPIRKVTAWNETLSPFSALALNGLALY